MRRLSWIENTYGDKLFDAVSNELNAEFRFINPRQLVDHFASYDPTPRKHYIQWMIKTYLIEGFSYEDLTKARETLEIYVKCQTKLSSKQRDIFQYRSLSALWKVVKLFYVPDEDSSLSSAEKRRVEKTDAYKHSIILTETENHTVAIPLSESAAIWWGRGTRWCTSAKNDNRFDDYHAFAPLIVFDLKRTGKFQFYAPIGGLPPEEISFMDSDDAPIGADLVLNNIDVFKPVFDWATEYNINTVSLYPREIKHQEFYGELVEKHGLKLGSVPLEFRSYDVCRRALLRDAMSITDVPSDLLDHWLVRCALIETSKIYPNCIASVPLHFLDSELCMQAVGMNGEYLLYMPSVFVTYAMVQRALARSPEILLHPRIAKEYQSADLARTHLSRHGSLLSLIPHSEQTYDDCVQAIRNDGYALKYARTNLVDRELCETVVSSCGRALEFVPLTLIDLSLCLLAYKDDSRSSFFVPNHLEPEFTRACAKEEALNPPRLKRRVIEPSWLKDEDFVSQLCKIYGSARTISCPV